MTTGIRVPNLPLNLPSTNMDYSSLGNFGNIGHSPTDFSLKTGTLPTQIGDVTTTAVRPNFLSWDSFWGGKNADGTAFNGWGNTAFNTLQGLGNAFMNMKAYGLAKDQLAFSKAAFEKNFAAQRAMTNTRLADRQNARLAANPNAYQSVGEYMAQNGIA